MKYEVPSASPEAIAASLESVNLALDSGPILGTWVWDVVGDRFRVDSRFARSFGLDPADCQNGLASGVFTQFIHEGDRRRVEDLIAGAMRNGGKFVAEYRQRQGDGSYLWIEASGCCYLDEAGGPARFPGVIIDIDQRKRAEDRLRQSEIEAREAKALLHAVIEAIPALVYVKNRDGRMQLANGPVLDLIGKPWAEVEGRTDGEFLDDKQQALSVMATDQRLMDAGGHEELEEVVGFDAVGPRTWLSNKRAFRDEYGAVIGLIGASLDISARKRAEEQRQLLLLEMNHRVKNLFALASGIVAMSARTAQNPRDLAEAVTGRLIALSRAHELILPAVKNDLRGEGAGLEDIVHAVVSPHLAPDDQQLQVGGSAISLNANAATAIALILHELATNASKYGCLSDPSGRLSIFWRAEGDDFLLDWVEEGGPKIADAPIRNGFGTKLARQSARGTIGGDIQFSWAPDGVRVLLTGKLALLVSQPQT